MGCDYFYDGSIKDREVQREAINFIRSYFDHIDDVLFVNHMEGVYVPIVSGYKLREGLLTYPVDYPFNFYGILPFAGGLFHHGASIQAQFVFNRHNNGRLVTLSRIPESLGLVTYEESFEDESYHAPEENEPMVIEAGGNFRTSSGDISFPLLLCAFKFRYCPELEIGDDYDTYDYVMNRIDEMNLHSAIYDKTLDYNAIIQLYNERYDKKYPKK